MTTPKKKIILNKNRIKNISINHVVKNKYMEDKKCFNKKIVCFRSCKKNKKCL